MLTFSLKTLALGRGTRKAPARVTGLAQRRLRKMVRLAVEGSSFYREKYRGIDLDRFRLDDLPVTNKSELMADFDRTVTDRAVNRDSLEHFLDDPANLDRRYLGRYVASHTSGSQGQPMLIVQEPRCVELFFGLQMTRGNNEPANPATALQRLVRRKRLAVVSLKRGFYPSAALFEHFPRPARPYVEVLRLSQTDPDLIDRLNAFRPDTLTAYAGVLEMLALEAEAGRLHLAPGLRQVVNNSEVLTERARARIEAAFRAHVMNNYATGECPFLSNGCRTDEGAHVNADWAILEVVDDQYRPVPPGTPGSRVLITNLANRVQPILRYEVGDVVTMADAPCSCGSRLPRVARIAGRAADVFWIGWGPRRRRLINLVFTHAFEYLTELREWQAVQQSPDRVLVRLEPLPGASIDPARACWAIERELSQYDYGDLRIEFESVPRLEADPRTGKFRRMVPLPENPAPSRLAG